jgi:hypothetical protein
MYLVNIYESRKLKMTCNLKRKEYSLLMQKNLGLSCTFSHIVYMDAPNCGR